MSGRTESINVMLLEFGNALYLEILSHFSLNGEVLFKGAESGA